MALKNPPVKAFLREKHLVLYSLPAYFHKYLSSYKILISDKDGNSYLYDLTSFRCSYEEDEQDASLLETSVGSITLSADHQQHPYSMTLRYRPDLCVWQSIQHSPRDPRETFEVITTCS